MFAGENDEIKSELPRKPSIIAYEAETPMISARKMFHMTTSSNLVGYPGIPPEATKHYEVKRIRNGRFG